MQAVFSKQSIFLAKWLLQSYITGASFAPPHTSEVFGKLASGLSSALIKSSVVGMNKYDNKAIPTSWKDRRAYEGYIILVLISQAGRKDGRK